MRWTVTALTRLILVVLLAACGTPPPTAGGGRPSDPLSASPSTTISTAPPASASPSPSVAPTPLTASTPLAVVAAPGERRPGLTSGELAGLVGRGDVLEPCGVGNLALSGVTHVPLPVSTDCVAADRITAAVRAQPGRLGLLPPGLVTPSVTVLPIDDADLFGSPSHRAKTYPLTATVDPAVIPRAWTEYGVGDIRTIVSVGDTCPSRGVSHQAVVLGKGWPWVLDGGTARYTGLHMDTHFSGPNGKGWPVVEAIRDGATGAVRSLLQDAELTVDDFECAMISDFTQDAGTNFSVDPRVAPLLAGAGFDVVTLGSNHITDRGADGVRQTIQLLDANGIAHVGAGMNLHAALAPAIVDVRGVRFAFVGWDDIPGSGTATATRPGVAAMTTANVRSSIAAARAAADVVIAMPQWGFPEYHAEFTATQLRQRALMYSAGADHVLGSGTHWAGAISVTPGPRGPQLAVTSHGNFLFGQSWSRQTMEGVLVEATFVGTRLAQVRLHPYVVLDQAQPNLIDPATDGATVLRQVYEASDIQ